MSVVSIVRGNDADIMVKEALELLGGLRNIVSGDSAMIKPNLGIWGTQAIPEVINRCSTTKPEVVAALIRALKEAGIRDISVGDGAILGMDATNQYKKSGMKRAVEAAGGRMVDLDREGHTRVQLSDNLTVEIARSVLETSNLINAPVMKTHVMTRISLGMKNLKGVLSKRSKSAMHRVDLEPAIALLSKAVRPRLVVVDGIIGMEGLGPSVPGVPTRPGLLIAGTDPVAVDAVTATVMGQEPLEVGYIRIAGELGLGETDPSKIELRGLTLEEAKHRFKPARLGAVNSFQGLGLKGLRYFGWEPGIIGSECSGCFASAYGAVWAMSSDVPALQKPLDIVIGPREVPEGAGNNILLYGNCQAKNRKRGTWLSGCPPTYQQGYFRIAKMTLSKPSYILAVSKRLFKGTSVRSLPEWGDLRETAGE